MWVCVFAEATDVIWQYIHTLRPRRSRTIGKNTQRRRLKAEPISDRRCLKSHQQFAAAAQSSPDHSLTRLGAAHSFSLSLRWLPLSKVSFSNVDWRHSSLIWIFKGTLLGVVTGATVWTFPGTKMKMNLKYWIIAPKQTFYVQPESFKFVSQESLDSASSSSSSSLSSSSSSSSSIVDDDEVRSVFRIPHWWSQNRNFLFVRLCAVHLQFFIGYLNTSLKRFLT